MSIFEQLPVKGDDGVNGPRLVWFAVNSHFSPALNCGRSDGARLLNKSEGSAAVGLGE